MATSPKSKKAPRVFVFIDDTNLSNSVKEIGYTELNYENLLDWLVKRKGATAIYYYAGLKPGDKQTSERQVKLRNLGYKLRVKTTKIYKNKDKVVEMVCPECSHKWVENIDMGYRAKANCDVTLTFDALRMITSYEKAIFFTGDGDFLDLLKYLVKRGRKVEIFSIGFSDPNLRRTSLDLRKILKDKKAEFTDLRSLPKNVLIQ